MGMNQIMLIKVRLQRSAEPLSGKAAPLSRRTPQAQRGDESPWCARGHRQCRAPRGVPPGEDIHLQAPLAKPPRQLGDVHVETSGIAETRCGQWRRCMLIIATRSG